MKKVAWGGEGEVKGAEECRKPHRKMRASTPNDQCAVTQHSRSAGQEQRKAEIRERNEKE